MKVERIAIINVTYDFSTGKIAKNLLRSFNEKGYEARFYYGRGPVCDGEKMRLMTSKTGLYIHAFLSRLTGLPGYFSNVATSKLLKTLKKEAIDTIIIINPHGYYINTKRLLTYIAKENLRLVYIMADESAFLGRCAVSPACEKYITGEGKCPNKKYYPSTWFFDTCSKFLRDKKKCYQSLKRAKFVGPEFVIEKAKHAWLGQYMKTEILDEAIDTVFYKPQNTIALKNKLGIPNTAKIILCIAPSYKGVEYFDELARRFRNNKDYFFIHIGSGGEKSHDNYLHIEFVKENADLVNFYSMADLFVFTSLADTMSNACLESLSCGTPLLAFDISGMPYLMDKTVGTLVEPRNVNQMEKIVLKVQKKDEAIITTCRNYALKRYNGSEYGDKVIEIIKSIE